MKTLSILAASLFVASAALPVFAAEGSVRTGSHTIENLGPANSQPVVTEGRNSNLQFSGVRFDVARDGAHGANSGK
jgi:hypothetical protein